MSPQAEAPAPPLVPVVPRSPWGALCLAAAFLTFPGMSAMTAAGVARNAQAWALGAVQFVLFTAGLFLVQVQRAVGVSLFLVAVLWAWVWGVLVFVRSSPEAHA